MQYRHEHLVRAARMVKILRLAQLDGMDAVAIKLNSEPTHGEIIEARKWAYALNLAEAECDGFNGAKDLYRVLGGLA